MAIIEHELVREADDDHAPDCPTCGGEMRWEDCACCDGRGGRHEHEDDSDEELGDFVPCLECEGAGGQWVCRDAPERCVPLPLHPSRGTGFYATSPEGRAMHVNGSRDMDDATLDAIGQIADVAYKQVAWQRGWED